MAWWAPESRWNTPEFAGLDLSLLNSSRLHCAALRGTGKTEAAAAGGECPFGAWVWGIFQTAHPSLWDVCRSSSWNSVLLSFPGRWCCRLAQTVWMPQVRSSRRSYCCSLHTHTGLCFINSSKPHDIIELVPLWNDACTFWKHPHERLVCELHLGWLLYSLLSGIDNRGTHLLFFFVFSAFRQVPHSAYLSHIYGWMAVPLLDLFWDIGAHFLPTGKLAFNCFTTVTSCHSSQLKKKVALHWSRF